MNDLFLQFVIGQTIVQTVLYFTLFRWLHVIIANNLNAKTALKTLAILSIAENIALTIAIVCITNSGALSGTANLLGSTVVGFIATVDAVYLISKKRLKDRNYIKQNQAVKRDVLDIIEGI